MGYRHTLISEDIYIEWPKWFIEKYSGKFNIGSHAISTIHESKFYENTFFEDVQKALIETGWFNRISHRGFRIVALSEDGAINYVQISKDKIKFDLMAEDRDMDSLDYYWA